MRPLAELIVRGRRQAIAIAVLSVCTIYFYWIGAAAVGLVTLRKGWKEGSLVLMWACLPAAVWAWFNEIMPLATLLGTAVAAGFLRWTISWRAALITASCTGLLTSAILLVIVPEHIEAYVTAYNSFIAELQQEMNKQGQQQQLALANIIVNPVFVAGIFGLVQAMTTVISTIIARWWQATLYNPGGFRQEFHALKMSPQLALILVAIMAAFFTAGEGYQTWASIAAVPLMICGIALIHGVVTLRGLNSNWLILFYVLLLLVDGVKLLIAALALIDSILDYRKRLARSGQTKD